VYIPLTILDDHTPVR